LKLSFIQYVDFEAAIPFQLLTVFLAFSELNSGADSALIGFLFVCLLAQFSLVTRMFDMNTTVARLSYLISNELYFALSVGALFYTSIFFN
jgi:hypothetical protein